MIENCYRRVNCFCKGYSFQSDQLDKKPFGSQYTSVIHFPWFGFVVGFGRLTAMFSTLKQNMSFIVF